jgi:preprotein translocase subunit SecA
VFTSLFGKKSSVQHKDDHVWKTAAACLNGLCGEAAELARSGRCVVVVTLANAAFEAVSAALAPQQPAHCRDIFGRDALRAALARPGAMVVALSGSLPAEKMAATSAVDILVYGRHPSRAADDAIARFADQLGVPATLAFYLSLEDPLLKPFVASCLPLLEQLGMREDEAIAHAMVTRAIQNCQAP